MKNSFIYILLFQVLLSNLVGCQKDDLVSLPVHAVSKVPVGGDSAGGIAWKTIARVMARTEGEFAQVSGGGQPCMTTDIIWVDPSFWSESMYHLEAGICYHGENFPEISPGVYRREAEGHFFIWDTRLGGSYGPAFPPPLDKSVIRSLSATMEYSVAHKNVAIFTTFQGIDEKTGKQFRLVPYMEYRSCYDEPLHISSYNDYVFMYSEVQIEQ